MSEELRKYAVFQAEEYCIREIFDTLTEADEYAKELALKNVGNYYWVAEVIGVYYSRDVSVAGVGADNKRLQDILDRESPF